MHHGLGQVVHGRDIALVRRPVYLTPSCGKKCDQDNYEKDIVHEVSIFPTVERVKRKFGLFAESSAPYYNAPAMSLFL
jgi:hypothetical protein